MSRGAVDGAICSGAPFDATDPLLGQWRSAEGAALRAERAIGGCAVLLFLEVPSGAAGPDELFAVLGYDTGAAQWVAWAVSTRDRGLQELTGSRATRYTGIGGRLAWSRTRDGALMFEWMDRAGRVAALQLSSPGY